jgi:hypothetical protein
MLWLPITLGTASILAIMFVLLSLRVVRGRMSSRISIGDGSAGAQSGKETEAKGLLVAVRSHANFAEYVPYSLLMLALLEGAGANATLLLALAAVLILARVLHPIGMGRPAPNPFRAGGISLQWLMLLVAGLYGLWLAFLR